jgi:hypothetical protein
MPRLVSLLPIPALAILAVVSCTRSRSEEPATRVIPPATAYEEPAPTAAPAHVLAPAPVAAPTAAAEDPPSAEEVKAFERPVAK